MLRGCILQTEGVGKRGMMKISEIQGGCARERSNDYAQEVQLSFYDPVFTSKANEVK